MRSLFSLFYKSVPGIRIECINVTQEILSSNPENKHSFGKQKKNELEDVGVQLASS